MYAIAAWWPVQAALAAAAAAVRYRRAAGYNRDRRFTSCSDVRSLFSDNERSASPIPSCRIARHKIRFIECRTFPLDIFPPDIPPRTISLHT